MDHGEPPPAGPSERSPDAGLVAVCLVAATCAVAVGFIGGAFRWALVRAADWRADLVGWTRDAPGPAWLIPVVVTAVGAGAARWLVRFAPDAAGSGVQEVEGVWAAQLPEPGPLVLPVKFLGGLLALGSGMVLGREGPTVHMGSAIGAIAGRRLRLPTIDARVLQASLGGAGLAVAFDAPVGGALFVFEEVARSFRPRLVVVTLIGSAIAVGCARIITGDLPDFRVRTPETPPIGQLWVFVAFGLLVGLLGAAYNALTVRGLRITDALVRVDPVVRATVVGTLVGALLIVDPLTVGGGEP